MRVTQGVMQTPIEVKKADLTKAITRSVSVPSRESALVHLVEAYLRDSLVRGLARATVAYRRVYLSQLLGWLQTRGITSAREVTSSILVQYLVHLKHRVTRYKRPQASLLSVKTLAAEASVLRSFFAWCAKRRVVLLDPGESLRLGDRTQPLPKSVLAESEVRALLATPRGGVLGVRDRAMLETLYSTGLRRAELCGLDLYDVDHVDELVQIRHGKGGKDRVVPIGARALAAVRRYVADARPALIENSKEPALFIAAGTRRRLSVKTLNMIVRKHADVAGIPKRVTPHALRHTCATHLLKGGADIRHVQLILGHASVATTQIYTRVAPADLTAVHRRCHPRKKMKIPCGKRPRGVSSC